MERLQAALNWNIRWLEHYKVSSEIILVNWNPISERPSVVSELSLFAKRERVRIRVIDVPESLHARFIDPDVRQTVPLYEFIAKNTGIRRAKGNYILCTNADVLIHPKIIRSIAQLEMKDGCYYRADRLDFHRFDGEPDLNSLWNAGFAISLKGFMYHFPFSFLKPLQYRVLRALNTLRVRWELFKHNHEKWANCVRLNVVYDNGAYHAHCLNSGDFMLMHRADWFRLKGYPEYTEIATHTDAIFTVLAHGNLEEKVLPFPVFHREHERRYTWEAIKKDDTFVSAYRLFEKISKTVVNQENHEKYLNADDWGLASEKLAEQTV